MTRQTGIYKADNLESVSNGHVRDVGSLQHFPKAPHSILSQAVSPRNATYSLSKARSVGACKIISRRIGDAESVDISMHGSSKEERTILVRSSILRLNCCFNPGTLPLEWRSRGHEESPVYQISNLSSSTRPACPIQKHWSFIKSWSKQFVDSDYLRLIYGDDRCKDIGKAQKTESFKGGAISECLAPKWGSLPRHNNSGMTQLSWQGLCL